MGPWACAGGERHRVAMVQQRQAADATYARDRQHQHRQSSRNHEAPRSSSSQRVTTPKTAPNGGCVVAAISKHTDRPLARSSPFAVQLGGMSRRNGSGVADSAGSTEDVVE